MANERTILCGDSPEPRRSVSKQHLRLALWGNRNVTLKIGDLSTAMIGNAPSAFLDLLEIATYVYCADQAVTRGGDGVDNVGADWRRHLSFRIPVRNLDLWRGDKLLSALTTTLGFLSDDVYGFEFTDMKNMPPIQPYLFTREDVMPERIEEVALFSGGLDSLGGAIREAVVDKRRVALVTHQPSKKLVNRQQKLRREITSRAAHPPLFVPVTINKQKALGREHTQRSRSFLFMALGATVAQMLGLSRVRFYENGVVSLNFPPSGQVVGAKATRTTHPQVLKGFAQILSLVAGRRFDVENPFLWLTKTDVVEQIVKAGCTDMIRFSTSCTHTWEMTTLHPHCGSCSQCIDRRFAVLAAGAADADPEEGYKTKLLVDARDEGESRTMLSSYVETASAVACMQPIDFFARFGEASRVLRHIDGSADATALKIYEIHKRHAQQVTGAVDQAIAAHAREIRERRLPASSLLRLVCDSVTAGKDPLQTAVPTLQPALSENSFQKKGQVWEVRYAGGRSFILLPSKGAAYLHVLLAKRGVSWSVTKLAALVAMRPAEHLLGDAGDGSDREALAAYRARYAELEQDLKEARSRQDHAGEARIREEMNTLAAQIRRDQGLGGRLRKDSDDRDRVRKAVRAAIRRAVEEIRNHDKRFAEHLKAPALKCGWSPCYDPRDPAEWTT